MSHITEDTFVTYFCSFNSITTDTNIFSEDVTGKSIITFPSDNFKQSRVIDGVDNTG